jgi:hypothetical protein
MGDTCFHVFVSDLGNGNQFPFPILEMETGFHDVLATPNSIVFLILETETSFRFLFWKRKPVSMMCLQR